MEDLWARVVVLAVPVLIAITLHEAAHGYVAWKLGDDTAYRLGRVTLNPFKHVDPFGTVLLPALLLVAQAPFLFGYAKPVPVNFLRLRNPKRDMVWVAAAGPAANIALAFASATLFHTLQFLPEGEMQRLMAHMLFWSIRINIFLALLNMLPLPPLDGGRVAVGLLPRGAALRLARLERFGLPIIFGVIATLVLVSTMGAYVGLDINLVSWLDAFVEFLAYKVLVVVLTGHG